jgi:hypothetical protein
MTDLDTMTREQLIGEIMYLRCKVSWLLGLAIPANDEGWEDENGPGR